jgi:hypothetical protein
LLGEAGVVEDQDAIALGGQAEHVLDALPVEVVLVPVDGRQKALEALLGGPRYDLGDGVAVLVGVLGEQPGEVAFQCLGSLAPVEVDTEGGEELGQLGQWSARGVWDSSRFHALTTNLTNQSSVNKVVLILALFIALSVFVLQVDGGQVTCSSLATGLVLAAMFGAYTVATVHDLFAWQRVRWEACSDLMARRVNGVEVPADQIDGGFEFNNQIPNERTIYTTSVNGDLVAEADAQARPYAVAFSELPGFETLERRRTPVWLRYPPQEILVLRRVQSRP